MRSYYHPQNSTINYNSKYAEMDKFDIKCGVCFDNMTKDIYCCKNEKKAHNICGKCYGKFRELNQQAINENHQQNENKQEDSNLNEQKLSEEKEIGLIKCPSCRLHCIFEKNHKMMKKVKNCQRRCPNKNYGCPEKFYIKDEMDEHLIQCCYSYVVCPFCEQNIKGGISNFTKHLKNSITPQENENSNDNSLDLCKIETFEQSDIDDIEISDIEYDLENSISAKNNYSINNLKLTESICHISDNEQIKLPKIVRKKKKNIKSSSCDHKFQKIEYQTTDFLNNHKEFCLHDINTNLFLELPNYGICLVFLRPGSFLNETPAWKWCAISTKSELGYTGNTRFYLQYTNNKKKQFYDLIYNKNNIEHKNALNPSQLRQPELSQSVICISRLITYSIYKNLIFQTSENSENPDKSENSENSKNSENFEHSEQKITEISSLIHDEHVSEFMEGNKTCSKISYGFIFDEHLFEFGFSIEDSSNSKNSNNIYNFKQNLFLNNEEIKMIKDIPIYQINCRFYCLSESVRIGAVIDVKDYQNKWYPAEIIQIKDKTFDSINSLIADNIHDHFNFAIRKFKLHYLGFDSKYDEWFDIDKDSHRIAHVGTYTVGPTLRAKNKFQHYNENK